MHNATLCENWPRQARELNAELTQSEIINTSRKTLLDAWIVMPLEKALKLPSRKQAVHIDGMAGLGDNIMQRSVIKAFDDDVYLATPWPQLYKDMPHVHCVNPNTNLRTQQKNAKAQTEWAKVPKVAKYLGRVIYHTSKSDMISAMGEFLNVTPVHGFDLPAFGKHKGNYVVVRPNTIRSEWRADARSPKSEYIAQAAQAAIDAGFDVISVADLEDGKEWIDGAEPPATIKYHKGELSVEELMALVAGAKGAIGGVGWLVCAASAYNIPMLLLFGGWGAANSPHKVLSPYMNLERITSAIPDNFCMCNDRMHKCSKNIANIEQITHNWVKSLE